MKTNPIEQEFENMAIQWEEAIQKEGKKIIRVLGTKEDRVFLEDFQKYMLAIDTEQSDLVFLLESAWSNYQEYSFTLLKELEEIINTWNTAERKGDISQENIDWKADYTLENKRNRAELFTKNINRLVEVLELEKNEKISFVLPIPFAVKSETNLWLLDYLDTEPVNNIRLGIFDYSHIKRYKKVAKELTVFTLIPKTDMDGAIESLAGMADPTQAENVYRKHFIALMNGVKKRKENEVQAEAKNCLDIAVKNTQKDINWLGQIVLVYITLVNDQLGYKNRDQALFFAHKAVEAAEMSLGKMESSAALRLYGQALMTRGALYSLKRDDENAMKDYKMASQSYQACEDQLLYIEATRLYAEKAQSYEYKQGLQALIQAFNLIDQLPKNIIENSTFPWLVRDLIDYPDSKKAISFEEIKAKAKPLFGEDWLNKIEEFGKKRTAKKAIYETNN